MAINTENRRRSVSGYTSLPMLPVANAVIDAFDREMVAWLYAGIAAGAAVSQSAVCLTLDPRSLALTLHGRPTLDSTLAIRSLALTLRTRLLNLTLPERPDCDD